MTKHPHSTAGTEQLPEFGDAHPTQGDEHPTQTADQRQADEQRRVDAEHKADERRAAVHEADEKRRADEYKTNEERIAAARKGAEARRKEAERRAALSPSKRVAEDEKRAAMTPDEKLADDESKGLLPEQQDEINLLVGTPSFPVKTETAHPTEFILSEANGYLSRDSGYLADPVTIVVGQPLKKTAGPTTNLPATYVPAAAGADCVALALYAGASNPTDGLRIAVLTRNAEVNGRLINWGAITAPEQAIGLATLATAGIIARF